MGICVARFALGVEYLGHGLVGWQSQENGHSVQGALEKALSQVANHNVDTFCAGRTDAGVHARRQVVHFDSWAPRTPDEWLRGTNTYLPKTIRVTFAQEVVPSFDARRSAQWRRYQYYILNQKVSAAHLHKTITWWTYPLKLESMQNASQCLIGEHDFTSFRAQACQAKTPFRNLHHLYISQQGPMICFDVRANAFLHHMVRNIVGSLLAIGQGKKPKTWLEEVLWAKDRKAASITAPADGLYLVDVHYPSEFNLPKGPYFPWFAQNWDHPLQQELV